LADDSNYVDDGQTRDFLDELIVNLSREESDLITHECGVAKRNLNLAFEGVSDV